MPSAVPHQSQTNKPTPRKPYKSKRKLTTLSFEQLDRAGTTIFTEDISSSSRIRRPSYVLRQGDVVGANMPDTIKLSKHRSKIYVGLSDASSLPTSRREGRGNPRSEATSSAATTIGKASIIDWTDAASDIGGNVPLSGELSIILPPVQGAQTAPSQQPPPGLDTSDIFSYRAVHHKRFGNSNDKSPRPPPSRGGAKFITGFRPPQNTPFLNPVRADEFASSLRKKITSRPPTFERCNVVVCGGGIIPMPGTSRESRQKSFYSRESTTHLDNDKRRARRDSNVTNPAPGIGTASFDLPVIDMKCIESPVADLGDLEQKGIRLVKLRNTKKKRHISQSSDVDKNGSINGDALADENGEVKSVESSSHKNNVEERDKDLQKPLLRLSLNGEEGDNTATPQEVTSAVNDSYRQKKNKSITTSSTGSVVGRKEPENGLEEIGTNREPYSTPLLPDLDTNRTNKSFKLQSPGININISHTNPAGLVSNKNELINANSIQINEPEKDEGDAHNVIVLVENVDPTPINRSPESPIPNSITSPREDGYTGDTEEHGGARRVRHRTSSLLSVPASLVSECRPPEMSPRENLSQRDTVFEDDIDGVFDGEGGDGVMDVKATEEQVELSDKENGDGYVNNGRRTSKTVSTQTRPKDEAASQ